MASHDRAESYINRLLEDRELQNDLRELLAAFRGSFDRAAAGRRKPTRLLENRKFQQQTQRAVASPRGGSARLRGESPNDYQGRRIVGVLLARGRRRFGRSRGTEGARARRSVGLSLFDRGALDPVAVWGAYESAAAEVVEVEGGEPSDSKRSS